MSEFTGQTVYLKPQRMIGMIIPDCTVEERHSDRLEVTRHPVEQGAMISDHAFMQPYEVSIRYGWSDSTSGTVDGIIGIYAQLRQLQTNREPFDINTGKRGYSSMLLTELEVTTDQHTENVLMVEAHCQQVIIVSTSEVQTDPTNQASPEQTQGVTQMGPQQISHTSAPPTISGLTSGAGGVGNPTGTGPLVF